MGVCLHRQIQDLLDRKYEEPKKDFVYKDIFLVGKLDYVFPNNPDEILEFKTSLETIEEAKPWQVHQLKMYCTMFNKPFGTVYQPMMDSNGIYLRDIGQVERDDIWAEKELEKLYNYHLRLEKIWNKKEQTNQ